MTKYIIALVLFALIHPIILAEDALFIQGSEVDGVRVGSFYIANEIITNQDFFIFIQTDGYKKLSLWDQESLKEMERFKCQSGEYGPRTWENSSPPMGKEFQPVTGITFGEANAYARSQGWLIPNAQMWSLAQKVKPDIGPYPWKDTSDNANAIRMARYYAPARMAEDRFNKLKEELENVRRSCAPISVVNLTSSRLQELERKFAKTAEDLAKTQEQLEAFKKITPEKLNQLDTMALEVASLNVRINKLEQEQKKTVESALQKTNDQIISLETKSGRLGDDMAQLRKHQQTMVEGMERMAQTQNNLAENQRKAEDKLKLVDELAKFALKTDEIDVEVKKLKDRVSPLEKKCSDLSKQVQSDIDKAKLEFAEQQKSTIHSINQNFDARSKEWDKKLTKVDDVEKQLRESFDQIKRLNALCPILPDNANYGQVAISLKANIDDAQSSVKKLQNDINSLAQKDLAFDVKMQDLDKKDKSLAQDTNEVREQLKEANKRADKHETAIAKLTTASTQLDGKSNDLENRLAEAKKLHNDLTKRTDLIDTEVKAQRNTLGQQAAEDGKIREEIAILHNYRSEHSKKLETLDTSIVGLRAKDTEMEKISRDSMTQIKDNLALLRNETDSGRKQVYDEIVNQVKKVNENVDRHSTEISGINSDIKNIKTSFSDSVKKIETDLSAVEKKATQLDLDLRLAATQMRHNMNEVGKTILQLFQKDAGMVIPPEKEVPQLLNKKEERREEKKEEPKEEKKEPVKATVDMNLVMEDVNKTLKNSLGALCYRIGEIHYQESSRPLALHFMNMALSFSKDTQAASFLRKNWPELNKPSNMVYVEPGTAHFGSHNDLEFSYYQKDLPGFYIDTHEVTNEEFARFVTQAYTNDRFWSRDGSRWRGTRTAPDGWVVPGTQEQKLPVVNVTFYEAEAYANWLGKRLPSPEEWERVARYTDMRPFPWGQDLPAYGTFMRANFKQGEKAKGRLMPVGSFIDDRTPEGVFDMAGNVSEWCTGGYRLDPGKRVIKGGSFQNHWYNMPLHMEMGSEVLNRYPYVGFRCAKDVPEKPAN